MPNDCPCSVVSHSSKKGVVAGVVDPDVNPVYPNRNSTRYKHSLAVEPRRELDMFEGYTSKKNNYTVRAARQRTLPAVYRKETKGYVFCG
jgi:hypothetical protein